MTSKKKRMPTSRHTADNLRALSRHLPLGALALFLCLTETPATLAAVVSALLFHEAGHLFFFLVTGVGLPRLGVEAVGLRLCAAQTLSGWRAILILGGGALFNLMGGVLFYRLGWTTVGATHLSAALFNLLPIGTTDGGQLFFLFARRVLPLRAADALYHGLTLFFLASLFFLGLLCFYFTGYGLSAVFFSLFFFFSCFGWAFHDF